MKTITRTNAEWIEMNEELRSRMTTYTSKPLAPKRKDIALYIGMNVTLFYNWMAATYMFKSDESLQKIVNFLDEMGV